MLSHFQDLKAQMNKARGEERRKLTKLTKESNGAINDLTALRDQGEAILRLAEHCRKLMVRTHYGLNLRILTQCDLDSTSPLFHSRMSLRAERRAVERSGAERNGAERSAAEQSAADRAGE